MELTEEQYKNYYKVHKRISILKAHPWFGSDQLKFIIKDEYDYYIDNDNKMFYVYSKKEVL